MNAAELKKISRRVKRQRFLRRMAVIMLLCGLAMSLLTLWMHRGNIVRLCKGEERKTNLFATGKQS